MWTFLFVSAGSATLLVWVPFAATRRGQHLIVRKGFELLSTIRILCGVASLAVPQRTFSDQTEYRRLLHPPFSLSLTNQLANPQQTDSRESNWSTLVSVGKWEQQHTT